MQKEEPIHRLADKAVEAQTKIQQDFSGIDPVIGLMRSMRDSGFPADAMTIDCLRSKRRIIAIIHDHHPERLSYQFGMMDQDPGAEFHHMALSEVTPEIFYQWIRDYLMVH